MGRVEELEKQKELPSPEQSVDEWLVSQGLEAAEWDRRNAEPNLSPLDVFINLAGWGGIIGLVILIIRFVLR